MFPLRDENPTELTPYLTGLFIAANVAAWFYLQGAGADMDTLFQSVCRWGTIPAEITGQPPDAPPPGAEELRCPTGSPGWITLLTSMFMHGSWLHLIGNMWFLWLFGNNVEDSMGHLRFAAFYLLTGAAASGAHILSAPDSAVPTVGASGAISGVMGAYLILYPRVRIHTLFVLVFIIRIFAIPAWFVLAEWFFLQLFAGLSTPTAGGGVAFWAHIGGFVAGVLLIKPFENPQLVGAKRSKVRLRRDQIRHGGWW